MSYINPQQYAPVAEFGDLDTQNPGAEIICGSSPESEAAAARRFPSATAMVRDMNAENCTPPTPTRPHTWRPDPDGGFVCEEEYGGCALWVSETAYIIGCFPRGCHWLPALHCEAGSGSGGYYYPHDVVTLQSTAQPHGMCVECGQRWTSPGKAVTAAATQRAAHTPRCEFMGDNAEDCLEHQDHDGPHRVPWERDDRPGELWYIYYASTGAVLTTEDSGRRFNLITGQAEDDDEARPDERGGIGSYIVPLF